MKKLLAVALFALLFPGLAAALDKEPFSKDRFEQLQADNELILVDIYADWCSTCAAQQDILADYKAQNPDVDLHILEIDFDKDKEWVRHFRAPRQSTLLLYRGEEQYWYSVAQTDEDIIFAELDRAATAE